MLEVIEGDVAAARGAATAMEIGLVVRLERAICLGRVGHSLIVASWVCQCGGGAVYCHARGEGEGLATVAAPRECHLRDVREEAPDGKRGKDELRFTMGVQIWHGM